MSRALLLLRREIALAWGKGGGPLLAVGFFLGVATLVPLSMGPDADRLRAIAPGISWVALALAALLSLERLFERDDFAYVYSDPASLLFVRRNPTNQAALDRLTRLARRPPLPARETVFP